MPPRPVVVFVVVGSTGHLQRSLPMIAAIADRAETWVYTEPSFADSIAAAGASFADINAGITFDEADGESIPRPLRYVSFAGHFGEQVAADIATHRPAVIVSDAFAVVGRVTAHLLGVPCIDIRSGHAVEPARFEADVTYPVVFISDRCHEAVSIMRDRFGMVEANPFMYGNTKSEALNICCEPPGFISPEAKDALAPVAFYGSLPGPAGLPARAGDRERRWFPEDAGLRVYASFGTVAWRYFGDALTAAATVIADAVASMPGAAGLVSFGGTAVDPSPASRPAVEAARWVHQWQVLEEADVFITHHGLNSTHEAVYHQVPMVSHPCFADQLRLAPVCINRGLAVPLAASAYDPIDTDRVIAALQTAMSSRAEMGVSLAAAREEEFETIARRPAVIDRILAFA